MLSIFTHVLLMGCLFAGCMGCALKHTPDLPNPKTAIHYQLGTIGLQAAVSYPIIQHDIPPQGFFEGSWRGLTQGAVVGVDIGKAISNLIWQGAVNNARHCKGKHCGNVTILVGAMSLAALATLIVTPTTLAALGGLTGGVFADSSSNVKAWQQLLDHTQARLEIQETMQAHLLQSIKKRNELSISTVIVQNTAAQEDLSSHLQEIDSLLETNVVEIGLVEHDSQTSGENINSVIHPSYHLYMLIETRLSRPHEQRILDQRKLGCLSQSWVFKLWAANEARLFHDQLHNCYERLAEDITTKLLIP